MLTLRKDYGGRGVSHLQAILFGLVLFGFLLLAAFFSFAETSMMAVNRYRLRYKARLKKRYAIHVLELLKRPDRVLSAILIGNTCANMLASSVATVIALHYWGEQGALLAAFILTLVVLIFAEILPKTLAAIYPDKIVRWIVYPTIIFLKLLYPLVWLANHITHGILRLFRISLTNASHESLSHEELRSIVYDTAGKLSRQYQNMLLTILDLNKLSVDDVMVPRHDMTGVDADQPWEVMVAQLNKSHQAWVPFYRQNVNQMLGVLYIRDLLRMSLAGQLLNKESILSYLQEPYFVPEGTALSMQLNYFQQHPDQVAFVVDEYGEIQGLLTLNDILEEIVGDFSSTLSQVKQRVQLLEDGSFMVDGSITVREFNRLTGWELPLGGPRTINGLIVEYLEMLPRAGVAVLINDYPIEVMQVKENHIKIAKIMPRLQNAISE